MAGSIDIVAIKPGIGITDGSLELGVADYNERSLEGVFNFGIDDRQAARLAFSTLEADPLYENKGPTRAELGLSDDGPDPRQGAAGQDNLSYRLSYLIEPTTDLSIVLTHDKSEEDGTGYTGSNFANPLGAVFAGGGRDYDIYSFAAPYGHIALQNGRIENDFDDWRIRFEYDVNPDWLTYGLIATGHKSGGFNDNLAGTEAPASAGRAGTAPVAFDATTDAPQYKSESVTYYEIGSKQEFDYGSTDVVFNVAGFYYDYNDMVVSTLTSVGSILELNGYDLGSIITGTNDMGNFGGDMADNPSLNQVVTYNFNAAEAEILGLNFDAKLGFSNGLNLDLSAVYMTSELKTDEEINDSRYEARSLVELSNGNSENLIRAKYVSIDGHELPRAPELQVRANLSRSENLFNWGTVDWIVSAGYRSKQYMTVFNGRIYPGDVPEQRLDEQVDGYWTFDAGVGWNPNDDEKLRVEAFVNNLTDEVQPQAIIITQRDNTRFFNRERTFGMRVRTKF